MVGNYSGIDGSSLNTSHYIACLLAIEATSILSDSAELTCTEPVIGQYVALKSVNQQAMWLCSVRVYDIPGTCTSTNI